MKKRLISTLLVFCMLLTMLPIQAFAVLTESKPTVAQQITEAEPIRNPFSDVKESDWFYDSVMYALQNGLFKGTSDTSFSPEGTMTRAMYVTVMGRIAEIDPADYGGDGEFTDVPPNSWYAPYVKWAKEKGITMGVGDGKFDPDGLVTREQMATLTVRFFDAYNISYPEATVPGKPADYDGIADYAREAVLKLWSCGLFRGDEKGNFNPKNNATRAEAATFCVRTDEVVENWFVETGKKPAKEEAKEEEKEEGKDKEKDKDKGKENNEPDNGNIGGNPGTISYYVSFMDEDKQLDRLTVQKGQSLTQMPSNKKTAKDGYIFIGWFTDKECTAPFYAEDAVNSNITVYAKYEKMVNEEVTLTSFSQMDQAPDLAFTIQRIGEDAKEPEKGIALIVMDGTAPMELKITDNGDNTYTVSAIGGFRQGSSYQLTLDEGYIFKDKAESIRTASFSIQKEEVNNLTLKEGLIFIKDTDEMSYKIGDAEPVPVLEAALMNSKTTDAVTGTFDYTSADMPKIGDILCIYETVDPRQRDYVNNDYSDDAEAYIEVTGVDGTTITFKSMDETDAEKVIFMPDTIPFSVAELPTGTTGTIESTDVDNVARAAMGLDSNPEVEKGDFVVLYEGTFADLTEEAEVYYGLVTDVSGTAISYKKTTKEEIEKSMDTFLQQSQKGDKLLEGVDTQALERQIENQVRKSGFDKDAAEYLAMLATQTNGFKTLSGLTDFSLTDKNGNPLTDEDIALMGIGANIKLSNDVKIKVELNKSSKYFSDGIRLALGIDAEFSVDMGDEGELKIDLSATFAEELAVKITAGAHAKVKWIFVFPKFKELSFRTAVDVKNYSAISIDVKMYTVEKEEESIWEKLKGIKGGQFKEVFENIEDLKDKIYQAKETADKIQGYKEDLERLWASVPSDLTNKAEYEGMLDILGELNVTQELMGLLNLTSETELDAGVRNLMERYSEMLENESDWIEIVNKKIFQQDIRILIFAIGIGANFVIKGNINLALGANMEYVIGKRYSFWFDIVSKTSGSSEMDLLDEKFAFQFYIMGQLGLKMGVEVEICVGIISTKIGSIGLTAGFGPYVEMWGYFIYEYTKLRPANTSTWSYDERMMGALYLEFGLYLEMTFKAQVLNNLFKYQPTLLDKKWPLLTAGTRNNVYGFAYKIAEGEVLPVKDADDNSANGITMLLPESYRQMEYIDLCEGDMEQEIYEYGKFKYTLSNRNFVFDENTGEISVNVPKGVQYMKCDLTLTWKADKLAFSLYDLAVTIPLVWTNLSNEELNQRYTASVRVGNAVDGYTTVWSQRVMKNAPFDLPTEAEIKTLLGVDSYGAGEKGNLKYIAISGYGDQVTKDLTIRQDTSYYFEVTPRTYTLTVKGVEEPNGNKVDRQFMAKFGQTFDLKSLEETGTDNDEEREYTTFINVKAKDSENKEILRNISEPIGKAFALEILNGATYTATYADNSATAIIHFEGVDIAPMEIKMKKGDVPSSDIFEEELWEKNAIVKSISPIFVPITGATTYTVVCEVQEAPVAFHKIIYNTNGGSTIEQQTYPAGSVITSPTNPEKIGYIFAGWYSDEKLTQVFIFTTMPDEDITLYARWKGKEFIVSFDENEGDPLEEGQGTKTVIYGESYGTLPVPVHTGFSFGGWYTERAEGIRVKSDTVVSLSADQTLYAHWSNKEAIDENIVSFVPNQSHDYNGEYQGFIFSTGDSGIEPDSFIIEYKRQNLDSSWSRMAINAGIYDIRITREEDDTYQDFEKTFTNAMIINKIDRTISANPTGSAYKANLLVNSLPGNAYPGDGVVEYAVSTTQTIPAAGWQTSRVFMNLNMGSYYIFARVLEGENYFATINVAQSANAVTVEGINLDATLGYSLHYMTVKTSDIKYAGTDSIIKGRIHYLDGTSSDLTHFDKSSNDFERGDLDTYLVAGTMRVPWMIKELEIDYTKKGTDPGWHCEYVRPSVTTGSYTNNTFYLKTVEGEKLSVNQWFGAEDHNQSHVVWKGSTDSMKRKITGVGNFESPYALVEGIILNSGVTGSYTFTYDGFVLDQYGYNFNKSNLEFEPKEYNAYDYFDAPTLSITTGEKAYEACVDYTINSFTLDKEALYAAMKAKGETETTFTVTLKFPERSTTADTATWTKVITVSIEE